MLIAMAEDKKHPVLELTIFSSRLLAAYNNGQLRINGEKSSGTLTVYDLPTLNEKLQDASSISISPDADLARHPKNIKELEEMAKIHVRIGDIEKLSLREKLLRTPTQRAQSALLAETVKNQMTEENVRIFTSKDIDTLLDSTDGSFPDHENTKYVPKDIKGFGDTYYDAVYKSLKSHVAMPKQHYVTEKRIPENYRLDPDWIKAHQAADKMNLTQSPPLEYVECEYNRDARVPQIIAQMTHGLCEMNATARDVNIRNR